jgi:hypothetical protein
MISYPVELFHDANGAVRVTAPHFPELNVSGNSEQDALMHARFALEEIISGRIGNQQVVPVPIKASPGLASLELPEHIAGVLEKYWRYNMGRFAPSPPMECQD